MTREEVLPGAGEPNLSEDEVRRRLPEVELIDDPHLRRQVIEVLQYTPDYWWVVPASTTGKYHNELAREECGLWIHTKMAVKPFMRLAPSWVKQDRITDYQRDLALAALLLHDMFKQGYEDNRWTDNNGNPHTHPKHDVLAARWMREHTELPSEVIHAVAAHNGPDDWGSGPEPANCNSVNSAIIAQLVHICDMMASDPGITAGVWKPSDEILDAQPDVPTVDLG